MLIQLAQPGSDLDMSLKPLEFLVAGYAKSVLIPDFQAKKAALGESGMRAVPLFRFLNSENRN